MDSIIQRNINGPHTEIHRAKIFIQPIAFCFQENLRPYTVFSYEYTTGFSKQIAKQTSMQVVELLFFVNNLIESTGMHIQSPL